MFVSYVCKLVHLGWTGPRRIFVWKTAFKISSLPAYKFTVHSSQVSPMGVVSVKISELHFCVVSSISAPLSIVAELQGHRGSPPLAFISFFLTWPLFYWWNKPSLIAGFRLAYTSYHSPEKWVKRAHLGIWMRNFPICNDQRTKGPT
jgi:hypothetical protein